MSCTNCHKELPEDARFCDSCGMQVIAAAAESRVQEDILSAEPVLESPVNLPAPEPSMDTMPLPVITMNDVTPAIEAEKEARAAVQTAVPPVDTVSPPVAPVPPPMPPPPVYTPPAYTQQPGPEVFQGRREWGPIMTLGQSIGFLVVMMLPLVNFIMLCVWAFGGQKNPSRQNLCRAILIVSLVLMMLSIIGIVAMVIWLSAYGYKIPWDAVGAWGHYGYFS